MSNRFEVHDEDLVNITGGKITYTWDGQQGSLGMNGRNPYILLNKDAFVSTYNELKDEKSDAEIIKELFARNIIKLP